MLETSHVIILCILALVAFILLIVWFSYYYKYHQCSTNPNFWCWNDYTCPYSPQGSWPGPQGVYTPLNNNCNFPGGPNGTGPAQNCTCTYQNTGASSVCNNTGNPPPSK